MKSFKYFLASLLLFGVISSCQKDDFTDTSFVKTNAAPLQLNALFDITQDNTGLVTITPNGEGASTYEVYFGHGTTTPNKVLAGKSIQHRYPEGVYTVKIVGYNLTGVTSETTKQLTVSFKAPENVEASATVDPANNFKVNVTAKADYETVFKVYFGDAGPNEVPGSFLDGETFSHTYTAVGTYTIKIEALSGGAAKTVVNKTVTIVNPTLLPLTFESSTIDYTFSGFGGASANLVSNPSSATGINTSAKVMRMVKGTQEVWAGSVITIADPIDFANKKYFRMKVYANQVNTKITVKVENLTDNQIFKEVNAYTTVANEWEDLLFDFTGINTSKTYQKLAVFQELGTTGSATPDFTIYVDDLRLTNNLPLTTIDFQGTPSDYVFENFGGAGSEVANNPNPSGINTSAKVGKMIKYGGEVWAGSYLTTTTPIDLYSKKIFKVKVYSPKIGTLVKFKLDGSAGIEVDATTQTANAWEELTFDFTGKDVNQTYNKVVLFFDFGTVGNGSSSFTYYFDDISQN